MKMKLLAAALFAALACGGADAPTQTTPTPPPIEEAPAGIPLESEADDETSDDGTDGIGADSDEYSSDDDDASSASDDSDSYESDDDSSDGDWEDGDE